MLEHGLLSEPKEDDHESYFGHCRYIFFKKLQNLIFSLLTSNLAGHLEMEKDFSFVLCWQTLQILCRHLIGKMIWYGSSCLLHLVEQYLHC